MSTREHERSVQFYVSASMHQALRIKSAVESRTLGEILRNMIDTELHKSQSDQRQILQLA